MGTARACSTGAPCHHDPFPSELLWASLNLAHHYKPPSRMLLTYPGLTIASPANHVVNPSFSRALRGFPCGVPVPRPVVSSWDNANSLKVRFPSLRPMRLCCVILYIMPSIFLTPARWAVRIDDSINLATRCFLKSEQT